MFTAPMVERSVNKHFTFFQYDQTPSESARRDVCSAPGEEIRKQTIYALYI
jgi:hypothetical protein